jgi:hypothetical protein
MVVPPFVRNFVYDVVAANRYRLFGTHNQCTFNAALKKRLLDWGDPANAIPDEENVKDV